MPCRRYAVDSIEKRERDAGINGFWHRHVGETFPRTIATPTLSFGFGITPLIYSAHPTAKRPHSKAPRPG